MQNKDNITKAVETFLGSNERKDKMKRFGNYKIIGDQLVYQAVITERLRFRKEQLKQLRNLAKAVEAGLVKLESHTNEELAKEVAELSRSDREWGATSMIDFRFLKQNVLAQRLRQNGTVTVIGNSSALDLVERKNTFGRITLARGETEVQRQLSTKIPMIPFVVFEQSGLDLSKLEIVEKTDAETIQRKVRKYNEKKKDYEDVLEPVHFTGACLFRIESKLFLFDIDRREVEHGIFNPFLVELPVKVKTIAEAYESLKPQEVKDAIEAGKDVLRQGEWFFIPVEDQLGIERKYKGSEDANGQKGKYKSHFTLQAGRNRPNYADQGFAIDGVTYVKGKIEHAGREHATLTLKKWMRAIMNTARNSFTIIGDVD